MKKKVTEEGMQQYIAECLDKHELDLDKINCIKVNEGDRVVFQIGDEDNIPPADVLEKFKNALDDFQTPGFILIVPRYGIKVFVVDKKAETEMSIPGMKPSNKKDVDK